MTLTFYKNSLVNLTFCVLLAVGAISINAQTTTFTYQGRLTDNSMAANGSYDMQFRVYDQAANGTQKGITVTKTAVPVANGVFTVSIDPTFTAFFNQAGNYLEISVRLNGSGNPYTTLAPRQQITSAPYAVQSISSQNADSLGGFPAANYLQTNGSGANLTNLNASSITAGTVPDARLASNIARTNAPNVFTMDQTINNADLYQSGGLAVFNVNSGFVASGTFNGTGVIPASGAGTRMMFYPKKGAFRAGRVFGSQWDDANVGSLSTALGQDTIASGGFSTALGFTTTASGDYSTALGIRTTASGFGSTATGRETTANSIYSTAIGAYASTNNQAGSFIYGDNSTTDVFNAVAPNSFTMRTTGGFASVGTFGTGAIPATGAGTRMMFYPKKAAFRAGYAQGMRWDDNNVGNYSTAMGNSTAASGDSSTAFGKSALAGGDNSTAMGSNTTANGNTATALGGYTDAGGDYATAMGYQTSANGNYSTALGYGTAASGDNSTVMGNYASTNNQSGSFVYGDISSSNIITATAPNQFTVRAAGGFRFRTNSALTTGCDLPAGSGVFQCTSSRSVKENFVPLNGTDILSRLRRVPVMQWNYIGEKQNVRHIGAFAEDFYQAFNLGTDDKSIGLLDVAGVNMAATKALDEKTENLQTQVEVQKSQIETQQKTIERQQQQIDALIKLTCAGSPSADVCRPEEK